MCVVNVCVWGGVVFGGFCGFCFSLIVVVFFFLIFQILYA